MRKLLVLSLVLLLNEALPGRACAAGPGPAGGATSCRACHSQASLLALRPASSAAVASLGGMPARQVPGTMLLDMLKKNGGRNWFGPVSFNHAGHIGMAGDCSVCHHHTPQGQQHPECQSCHGLQPKGEEIRMPSLKGAFHRQCMGCHREWAHADDCQTCHQPNGSSHGQTATTTTRPLYMGGEHPAIAKPDVEVYKAEYKPGVQSIVVFHHNDHIERYGNTCADCHRSDNCTRCHAAGGQREQKVDTWEDRHQFCSACHKVDDATQCVRCHSTEGAPKPKPFDHAETGWALASYHQPVGCRACHKQVPFRAMDTRCDSCHAAPVAQTQAAPVAQSQPAAPLASGFGGLHPHEPFYDYIRTSATDDLCLSCHHDHASGQRPQMHPTGHMHKAIPDALIEAGAQAGPGSNELTCLVCHSTATVRLDPIVLPGAGPDGLCLACHPQQGRIFGTVHDVVCSGPVEAEDVDGKGIVQATAAAGGTCRTCHLAHGPARDPAPTKGDPAGECTACHQLRGWAQAKCASPLSHPNTACKSCHNPHESRYGKFLAKPLVELCTGCHPEQAGLAGGPHDSSRHPGAWRDSAAASRGACLACHVPHGNDSPALLRFSPAQAEASHDAACLACHPGAAWDAKGDIAILHPRDIEPGHGKVDTKLVATDPTGRKRIGCGTCHDVHGGAKPTYLTRGSPDEPTGLCLQCHAGKRFIKYTGHSTENLQRHGFDAAGCRPCHAMHANREKSWGQMLSPRFLSAGEEGSSGAGDDNVPCLACHRAGGPAPVRAVATHPHIPIPNVIAPDAAGFLPLFDASGHVSPDGQVTCRTCHLSHGRLDLLQFVAEQGTMSEQDRVAMRLNLRAFVAPNICTECHGEQARLRFLMFHNPARREKFPDS
jgi:predicted CXXCH cytochrome family protein